MSRSITASRSWTALIWIPFLAACGGDGSGTPTDPGGGTPPPGGSDPVATTSVGVRDDVFDPTAISVSPGATVTWTWSGSNLHNVTWASADLSNSDTQSAGTHQVTMPNASGELVYFCTIHGSATSGMRGTIQVQ